MKRRSAYENHVSSNFVPGILKERTASFIWLCDLKSTLHLVNSIGSSGRVGGPRNMKSMWLPLAAIFFMTYLYRAGGPWPPRHPPPGSATVSTIHVYSKKDICLALKITTKLLGQNDGLARKQSRTSQLEQWHCIFNLCRITSVKVNWYNSSISVELLNVARLHRTIDNDAKGVTNF